MKYKVNGKIIDADNELNAVKKYKNSEIDYLIQEENKAVNDYKNAIKNTNDTKLIELYQHILDEELEHIRELTAAKENNI